MIYIEKPLFCPNKNCKEHFVNPGTYKAYIRNGFRHTKSFGKVQCYKCSVCGKKFSSQTFSLDFYAKRIISYEKLEEAISSSVSIRSMSRMFKVSTGTIANKTDRFLRQTVVHHDNLKSITTLYEAFCCDGFESFDHSQYFPNNYTLAIGARSRFIYDVSHCAFKRKGRMTKNQKTKAKALYSECNFEKAAVKRSFIDIIPSLCQNWFGHPIIVHSDEHKSYPEALKNHRVSSHFLKAGLLEHKRTSSKIARDKKNPLFPVNYIDREIRKDCANHRRETACFNRNPSNGMARFSIYMHYRNYIKAFSIVGSGPIIADDEQAQPLHPSHAIMAGIDKEQLLASKEQIYKYRVFLSHKNLSEFWLSVWMKKVKFPLPMPENYLPKYALE